MSMCCQVLSCDLKLIYDAHPAMKALNLDLRRLCATGARLVYEARGKAACARVRLGHVAADVEAQTRQVAAVPPRTAPRGRPGAAGLGRQSPATVRAHVLSLAPSGSSPHSKRSAHVFLPMTASNGSFSARMKFHFFSFQLGRIDMH